jgi:fumarate reductase flavoprotein subunit
VSAIRPETHTTDILILGSGGAGLFAALHARRAAPTARVTVLVKGLMGKSGCTRMVQGGYNVALAPEDSVERHFMDTIEGGAWINDQELAWTLVETAPRRIRELETEMGCFFDRNPDGTIHQKAFAGQTFDRTVHKGDLTGIEIVSRLAEQVWASGVERMEEHRALALLPDRSGGRIAGVLALDIRRGVYRLVRAKAVLLATGGGPTMYRYHTPSGDKACDGMAMALRLGLALRDMEMVQFHPTGLMAGDDTRITGTIIEEGLRGAGAHLVDADGDRFMLAADPRGERATRDIVSRAMAERIADGRTGPNGGVFLTMRHLDPAMVRRGFKGMVERCRDVGFDLVEGLVEVAPTAHYMMGGVVFGADGATAVDGLFAAGEDTGGVHGANRLGGNGVANSTVFGGIAGLGLARVAASEARTPDADPTAVDRALAWAEAPLARPRADLADLRRRLMDVMWRDVGIIRDPVGLARAEISLDGLADEIAAAGTGGANRAFALDWAAALDLANLTLVGRAIRAAAAARDDSRGAHFRRDRPTAGPLADSRHTRVRLAGDRLAVDDAPVRFTRVQPGESLIDRGAV